MRVFALNIKPGMATFSASKFLSAKGVTGQTISLIYFAIRELGIE